VPWSENNRGLIGVEELALMKKSALLVNTSRGPVVNQDALVAAIKEGRIAGAGLDVFDPEPFQAGSDILKFDNIITTPHVGAATKDNFFRAYAFCAKNILKMEQGNKADNIVNGL
jgi:phosphoglycerate dehydrogenase-like enzyme